MNRNMACSITSITCTSSTLWTIVRREMILFQLEKGRGIITIIGNMQSYKVTVVNCTTKLSIPDIIKYKTIN